MDPMKTDLNLREYLLPTILSLFIGLLIGWIDSGPKWDDTGITAFAIFIATLVLGASRPKGAWLWALFIGGSIVLFNIFRNGSFQSLLALVISFIGAYSGFGLNRLIGASKNPR